MNTFSDTLNTNQKIENQKLLWFFTLLYCVIMIFSNLFDPRLIQIPFFNLATDAGTLIFPITFLVSNIITEVYGYKYARRAIWCGFLFNSFGLIFGQILIRMPSPSFADNSHFDAIIHEDSRIVIASMLSYLIAEPLDSFIMSKMKIKLKDLVALRFIVSTIFSSLLDSFIFTFIAFYGKYELKNIIEIMLTMWAIKVFIEVFCTPFSVKIVKWLKKHEKLDVYDRKTKFNVFSLNTDYTQDANEYKKETKN